MAPLCYWAVYRAGPQLATVKAFFDPAIYESYLAELARLYPDLLDQPHSARGCYSAVPELNGLVWRFPFDPAMPGLFRALDGQWVADALRRRAPVAPEVQSYRPEVGSLLRYRSGERLVAYGKALAEDSFGLIVYSAQERLWRAGAAGRLGGLRVPRPLAFCPEAGLLLAQPVRGRPVGRDRNTLRFLELVRAAAAALAALHRAELPPGPERRLEDALQRLHQGLEELRYAAPGLHRSMGRLLDQIARRAARSACGPAVPSHGDFKYDQFLIGQDQYWLLDFETYCQAEPAHDVGYFCAYLPASHPADWREGVAAEQLRREFLQSYVSAAGPVDLQRAALHEATTLALRALTHVWAREAGWETVASGFIDLGLERLVNPEGVLP